MDILMALPLELSMRVLRFLAPVDTIRLRLVSKRYHDLLTSEETCSFLSHRFITPEYNSTKALPSWRLHYENHVSRRLSFASGKPWGVEILGQPSGIEIAAFCPETLCLALSNDAGESVSVEDLNSYPAKCVFPSTPAPDGSLFDFTALLPSFVVAVTGLANCYAWNLETHQRHHFKLPNSDITSIHGSGNLVAIAVEGLVVIHDVQTRKTASFKDTNNYIRVWEEEEISILSHRSGIIANPEKQVVWMFSEASENGRRFLVTDSLHLETKEVVQIDIRVMPEVYSDFYFANGLYNGLWVFLDQHDCRPGANNTQKLAKRVFLDQATGRRAVEHFPVEYPTSGAAPALHQRGPAMSPDGLGCLVDGVFPFHVWVLNREPGDEVARVQPLDLRIPEKPYSCVWFCDKFALFYTPIGIAVVRFKGIHDKYDEYVGQFVSLLYSQS